MTPAPFHHDIAGGPEDAQAHWLTTADKLTIRAAHWRVDGAKGTVLLFPGRTEFIEKYGLAAGELAVRGFATVAVDWRGQGLADRLLNDRAIGHVNRFQDYQLDVAATVKYAQDQGMPAPFFLLGHSMGGCIGLRALNEGLDVKAAAFSAPMWGVGLAAHIRTTAWAVSTISKPLGFSDILTPGQSRENYLLRTTLEENGLTNDATMFGFLKRQITTHPELGIAGPSLRWLNESLNEMKTLAEAPSPDVPCITYLGSDEEIVDPVRIRSRMAAWPNGTLVEIPTGRHEMLMDAPAMRDPIYDGIAALFDSAI